MKPTLDATHDQVIAALIGIAKGVGLNDSMSVPDFGSRVRVSKALNDACEYLCKPFHPNHFELVDSAFSRLGVSRSGDQIDECARALFNILHNEANLRERSKAAVESRFNVTGSYVRQRDGRAFKFFGYCTSDFPTAWEANIWYDEDKPHNVLKDARAKLSGSLVDIETSRDFLHELALDTIKERIEFCRTI